MSRIIPIFFLLIANFALVSHAVLPHHHHDGQPTEVIFLTEEASESSHHHGADHSHSHPHCEHHHHSSNDHQHHDAEHQICSLNDVVVRYSVDHNEDDFSPNLHCIALLYDVMLGAISQPSLLISPSRADIPCIYNFSPLADFTLRGPPTIV